VDELDRVRALLPEQPPPSPPAQAKARARLLKQVEESRRRPVRRSAIRAVTAALATAAVLALLVGPVYLSGMLSLSRPDGSQALDPAVMPPATATSAKEVLLDAARGLDSLEAEPVGAYWKVRSMHVVPYKVGVSTKYVMEDRNLEERWIPADAKEQSWNGACDLGMWPKTAADERAWASDGRPGEWDFGGHTLVQKPGTCTIAKESRVGFVLGEDQDVAYSELDALPTDASALRTYLWERRPSDNVQPTQWLYSAAATLLSDVPAQPKTRAAALRLLATLPGVTYVGRVRDPVGRSGLGIALTDQSGDVTSTHQLIVDPRTGKLLARTLDAVSAEGDAVKQGSRVVLSADWTNAKPLPPDPKLK
jgi:hypothetical protein